ncbi:MAG: hypothetical protein VKI39_02415 [Synechococcus sp.]|nr:hypothetical protein [Synechococcus sp.]
MTQALSAAVATAALLPEEEQDLLERLAHEAIEDFQAGRVASIAEIQEGSRNPADLLSPCRSRLARRWSAEGRHCEEPTTSNHVLPCDGCNTQGAGN